VNGHDVTLGFVHADRGALVDGAGRPLVMRGVGLGNWLLPEGYMWRFEPPGPQSPRQIEALIRDLVGPERAAEFWIQFRLRFVTEADIVAIADAGFDHVRLPINARVVIDDDGALIDDGIALVDRLIEWCRSHGLWVVLDLHGAPGGQTGTNIDDSPHGVPELFTDDPYRELTVTLWRALAQRYRGNPTVAGYDLLNEPLPDQYQHRHADDLVALYCDLTDTVREVDRDHLIIYEGMHWASNWSIFDEVWDDNSMLQFHRYWSPPDRSSIAPYLDVGRRLGLPIYMGEGGENNSDWIHTAFQLYDDHDISWNFWPWKKIATRTSPLSVVAPDGWDDIVAYGAGRAARPQPDDAWVTLLALLDGFAVDRCEYRADVIAALFRRPPVRVPASAFGFRGRGVSYSTQGSAPLDGFRQDDAVTLRMAADVALRFDHNDGTPRSSDEEVHVSLGPGDWVSYDVTTSTAGVVTIEVALAIGAGVSSDGGPIDLAVDAIPVPLTAASDDSVVGSLRLTAGGHTIRVAGGTGGAVIRWIDVA
jgi:endoglucanase